MRPLRLELEGFASFKARQELTFDGADLFVLTGPTGAGKSSIIDAITFALYGFVARYDRNQTSPDVISKGSLEARVRLDFSIGPERYTIARSLRANGGHKVSLERGDVVVTASVNEARAEVKRLLGLDFSQFTRCVVLPQGDFAQFLHSNGAQRQDLLVDLLGVKLYRDIHDLAAQRGRDLAAKRAALDAALSGELVDATQENLADLQARHAAVVDLCERFAAQAEAMSALEIELRDCQRRAQESAAASQRLRGIAVPRGVAELGERLALATGAHERARLALEAAAVECKDAQAALDGLPQRAALEGAIATHARLAQVRQRLEEAEAPLQPLHEELDAAVRAIDEAETRVEAATRERERVLQADAAYHASQGLSAGDRCPVCGETLASAPALTPPAGMDAIERAVAAATNALRTANNDQSRAAKAANEAIGQVESLRTATAQAARDAEHALPLEEATALLETVDEASKALAMSRAAEQRAANELNGARARLDELDEARTRAWGEFEAAWKPYAGDSAPGAADDDLPKSWQALVGWAQRVAGERDADLAAIREQGEAIAAKRQEALWLQAAACAEAGITINGGSPNDAAQRARGQLEAEARALAKAVERRQQMTAELADLRQAHDTAATLTRHMERGKAGFEAWLMASAVRELCEIASRRLRDLSSGAYSLGEQDGDLVVIDHANADTVRPVKTLSGGETFLASLSLALALAEQVAQVSPQGAAHLESLFLDEGFGTLDSETLDVVRDAVQELRSTGRMVGIITHVRELAEQIPVQFRVTKDARSSRVERVPD